MSTTPADTRGATDNLVNRVRELCKSDEVIEKVLSPRQAAQATVTPDGCIFGPINDSLGYCRVHVKVTGRKRPIRVYAHRVAYELFIGPIPDDMEIDHVCRVRNCINPDHLEAVTHQENIARRPSRAGIPQPDKDSRHDREPGKCSKGHEYTPENTYLRPDGRGRMCRKCNYRNVKAHGQRYRTGA